MSPRTAAILSALLLAGFLLLRPVVAGLGAPAEPDVRGRSSAEPPSGPGIAAPLPIPAPVEPAAATGTPGMPAKTPAVTYLGPVEERIFELTNEERQKAGLPLVVREETLRATARAQSADMMARRFFEHVNPDGLAPEDRVAIHHRRLVGLVSENLWKGTGFSGKPADEVAREIVAGWMKSPGHRANILRQESTHLGVGVCATGGDVWATQNFARVLAYLDQPLPGNVRRGAPLSLALTAVAKPDRPAAGFDLWSPDTGLAGARTALAGSRADATPGIYKLRVYFAQPEAGRFSIVPGPQIEVK